jgi:hypothetical protein
MVGVAGFEASIRAVQLYASQVSISLIVAILMFYCNTKQTGPPPQEVLQQPLSAPAFIILVVCQD